MYQLTRSSDAQFVLQSELEEMRILSSSSEDEQTEAGRQDRKLAGWS